MSKYVIYARKSTESEDRQVLSIDSQVNELRQLARRHNVEVAEVLTESRSAKAPGRPVFGDLMRRVRRGEVRGILCWKMDRLSRNPYDSGTVLQAQADGKLEQIITSDGTKNGDGNDRLMGTFELAIAAKFIDDLRANVKRGNRARFEKGWPNHLPPIGYLNEPATKTVIKDKERFALVRRMWDELLAGRRPKEIAQMASRDWGLVTVKRGKIGGKPIGYSSIYNILSNPYYAGFMRLKDGRQYLGAHEPMITPEEFERAQKILGNRARVRYLKHDNPFAGLMRCGNCGCSVVAEFHEKRGRTYTYHRCCRNKPGMRCKEKPISQSGLHVQLAAYFRRLAIPEPLLAFLRQKLERYDGSQLRSNAHVREQREKALHVLERERKELLGMRLRLQVSDEEFQRERESLSARQRHLEQALAGEEQLDAGQDARKAEVSKTLDLVHGAPLVLEKGDPVQLRSILQQLQLKIALRGRRLDVSVTEPLSHLVKAGSNSNWCASWFELWKWIQFGDQARQLGISETELRTMMGEDLKSV